MRHLCIDIFRGLIVVLLAAGVSGCSWLALLEPPPTEADFQAIESHKTTLIHELRSKYVGRPESEVKADLGPGGYSQTDDCSAFPSLIRNVCRQGEPVKTVYYQFERRGGGSYATVGIPFRFCRGRLVDVAAERP